MVMIFGVQTWIQWLMEVLVSFNGRQHLVFRQSCGTVKSASGFVGRTFELDDAKCELELGLGPMLVACKLC